MREGSLVLRLLNSFVAKILLARSGLPALIAAVVSLAANVVLVAVLRERDSGTGHAAPRVAPRRVMDEIQRALLNHELPEASRTRLHGRYLPAATEAHVGGDWYDALRLDSGRLFISIGDVAGHGVEAAGHMVAMRQAILVAALQGGEPAKALAYANRAGAMQGGPVVTAVCGFIDLDRGILEYATAGHPPLLLVEGSSATFLPYDGLALGIEVDASYCTFRQALLPGSLLVLYTDGLVEYARDIFQANDKLQKAAVAAVGRDDPAAHIEQVMFADASPTDDVAILTIAFAPEEIADPASGGIAGEVVPGTVSAATTNGTAPIGSDQPPAGGAS